jgi:hypothetical protein
MYCFLNALIELKSPIARCQSKKYRVHNQKIATWISCLKAIKEDVAQSWNGESIFTDKI